MEGIEVLFCAGYGPVVRDDAESRKLYMETLGIPMKIEANNYCHTEALEGAKYFALWPLSQAAESCFGKTEWPENLPVPQAWFEFEVKDVAEATETLRARGYNLLVSNRTEPWGQVVTRLMSPEGILTGVVSTPWLRGEKK